MANSFRAFVNPYMTVDIVGMNSLGTLPARAEKYFHQALLITVPPAIDSIIRNAQSQLQPGHGYDTGLLHDTLTKEVISTALSAGVIFGLLSEQADYWASVEFGYMHNSGVFVPGYHYFANAINSNRGRLGKAAHAAWRMAAARLSAESSMSIPRGLR